METHWKKLTNPNYIGAYDFETNEKRVVKIKEVKQEKVYSPDNKMTDCIVAYLEGFKPLVLCKTNCKMISKLLDTPMIEKWAGKTIQLEVKKVKAFGDWVDALRVSDKLPEVKKETLTTEYKHYEAIKTALKEGKTTIDALKNKYEISKEIEIKLALINN